MFDIETIAQAAADAAYNAVHAHFTAHTAPAAAVIPDSPAAPALSLPVTPQATATPDADAGANAFAAFRTAFAVPMAAWKAHAPKGSHERAAIRAAFGGGFDRIAQKGDTAAAVASFGANAPAMQALAVSWDIGQPAEVRPVKAAAQATGLPLTLPGMAQAAPVKAPKEQPAGTVALNGAKKFAKAQGLTIPAKADDVDTVYGDGTYVALRAYVEQERAAGRTCNADSVAAAIATAAGM